MTEGEKLINEALQAAEEIGQTFGKSNTKWGKKYADDAIQFVQDIVFRVQANKDPRIALSNLTDVITFVEMFQVEVFPDSKEAASKLKALLPGLQEVAADAEKFYREIEEERERLKQKEKELEEREKQIAEKEKAPPRKVKAVRADNSEFPIDKPNGIIWACLSDSDTSGQIAFNLAKGGKRSRDFINAYFAINFDELTGIVTAKGEPIIKQLRPFDKRVYIAASALWNAGADVVSLTQIYNAMGYKGNPQQPTLEKINDSITKMRKASIYFDNAEEVAAKYKYPHFRYEGYLFPCERITAEVGGVLTESAIHLFREPPLITFAKERKQVTTLPVKLLQSPLSKTDDNIMIEDYLFEQIAREKKSKKKRVTILLETLYSRAKITTKMQKYRAPKKIEEFLKHLKKEGYITGYTMQKEKAIIEN